MRKGFAFLLAVAVALGTALLATRVPDALAHVDAFKVKEVTMEGGRYLSYEEALQTLAIPEGTSVWDDLEPFTLRLREHPVVHDARVRRRLPSTLVLEVTERVPVALIPTPTLTPVDLEGRLLPIDPALHRMDLPLLQPLREPTSDGTHLTPAQVRMLAAELHRVGTMDPDLLASVSDVAVNAWGDVLVRLGDPRLTLFYRAPLTPKRLREGLLVLADAMERYPERRPSGVDLRFEDQVVVRFPSVRRVGR